MPIHDKVLLKKKRIEKELNRKAIADCINTSPASVQRIEEGTRALKIKELLLLARKFEIGLYDIIDKQYHHFLEGLDIGNTVKLHVFENYEAFANNFSDMEKEGRIAVHTAFPSSLYLGKSDAACKRFEHFSSYKVENKEFCPLRSLIAFAFSPCSQYTDDQKVGY